MTRPQRSARSRDRGSLRGSTHVRLRVGLLAIAMLLSLFGARLFQLQGVDSKAYASRAEAAGLVNIALPATRGRILDRNGTPLAESVAGMMVVADPTRTTANAESIAKLLADRLHLDYFDLLGKLTAKSDNPATKFREDRVRFVYIARRIPSTLASSVMDTLKAHDYVGVDTRADPLRTYPAGDVGGQPDRLPGQRPHQGLRRPRAQLQQPACRQGRQGDLRGRRWQPDPAGRQHPGQAGQRQGPEADHRP